MQIDMVFIIADISGYTKYMLDNESALAHSQGIISELLNTVIKQVQIPIRIAKFEGDAIFLFSEKRSEISWGNDGKLIGESLPKFMLAFDKKLDALVSVNSCPCGGCKNMNLLRLKIIAHKGIALKYKMGEFTELSGKDVIIVHRLLKNTIPSNKYIMLSEAAQHFLNVVGDFTLGIEKYEDIGDISVYYQLYDEAKVEFQLKKKNMKDVYFKKKWELNYLFESSFTKKTKT